jgi:hypothetical protein
VETSLGVTFAIDAPGGQSGPFDAGGLGIWYYVADVPFRDLEPAGRRLRELFAGALDGRAAASRWAELASEARSVTA